jgi:hypothetical protein
MNHEHTTCEHELKYCKSCNTVYCDKCKEEWEKSYKGLGGYNYTNTPNSTWVGTQ